MVPLVCDTGLVTGWTAQVLKTQSYLFSLHQVAFLILCTDSQNPGSVVNQDGFPHPDLSYT